MAKKKSKNLQNRLLKKQQLQQISQGGAPLLAGQQAIPQGLQTAVNNARLVIETVVQKAAPLTGIWRTVASTVVVIILLVSAIIINHKTTYLAQAGTWLYAALKLGKS